MSRKIEEGSASYVVKQIFPSASSQSQNQFSERLQKTYMKKEYRKNIPRRYYIDFSNGIRFEESAYCYLKNLLLLDRFFSRPQEVINTLRNNDPEFKSSKKDLCELFKTRRIEVGLRLDEDKKMFLSTEHWENIDSSFCFEENDLDEYQASVSKDQNSNLSQIPHFQLSEEIRKIESNPKWINGDLEAEVEKAFYYLRMGQRNLASQIINNAMERSSENGILHFAAGIIAYIEASELKDQSHMHWEEGGSSEDTISSEQYYYIQAAERSEEEFKEKQNKAFKQMLLAYKYWPDQISDDLKKALGANPYSIKHDIVNRVYKSWGNLPKAELKALDDLIIFLIEKEIDNYTSFYIPENFNKVLERWSLLSHYKPKILKDLFDEWLESILNSDEEFTQTDWPEVIIQSLSNQVFSECLNFKEDKYRFKLLATCSTAVKDKQQLMLYRRLIRQELSKANELKKTHNEAIDHCRSVITFFDSSPFPFWEEERFSWLYLLTKRHLQKAVKELSLANYFKASQEISIIEEFLERKPELKDRSKTHPYNDHPHQDIEGESWHIFLDDDVEILDFERSFCGWGLEWPNDKPTGKPAIQTLLQKCEELTGSAFEKISTFTKNQLPSF